MSTAKMIKIWKMKRAQNAHEGPWWVKLTTNFDKEERKRLHRKGLWEKERATFARPPVTSPTWVTSLRFFTQHQTLSWLAVETSTPACQLKLVFGLFVAYFDSNNGEQRHHNRVSRKYCQRVIWNKKKKKIRKKMTNRSALRLPAMTSSDYLQMLARLTCCHVLI